jgi:hypothetical protein
VFRWLKRDSLGAELLADVGRADYDEIEAQRDGLHILWVTSAHCSVLIEVRARTASPTMYTDAFLAAFVIKKRMEVIV